MNESFRKYLVQVFEAKKKINPRYSLRAYAMKLGIQPATLSALLKGKRPISEKTKYQLGQTLNMSLSEIEAFPVHEHGNRKLGYEEISLEHFLVISDYHHYALLELTLCEGFTWDKKEMAKKLGVKVKDVIIYLQNLETVGFLKKTDWGYEVLAPAFTTDIREHDSHWAHRHFQKQTMSQSMAAIDEVPIEKRDHTSITLAIDGEDVDWVKSEIKKFRRKMASTLSKRKKVNTVYHMNISFFPLIKE